MADSIASITYSIALSASRTTFAFLQISSSCELFFRTSPFIFLVFSYSNQETSTSTCTMNLLFLYILEQNPSPCYIIKICNIRSKLYRTSKLIFCIHQPNETQKFMFRIIIWNSTICRVLFSKTFHSPKTLTNSQEFSKFCLKWLMYRWMGCNGQG